jgi:hypothetical protein
MFAARQFRLRVLDALDTRVKQFLRRDELWPLRVPREPLLLDEVVRQALGGDAGRFDAETLRARTLLSLEWADESWWRAWAGVLPSGLKIYCDSCEHESRVLASGGRNEGDDSDRAFLQLFGESAGRHFGIEMSGGAPRSVRSPFPRELLVELFVNLFEMTGTEESVRDQLGPREARRGNGPAAGHDFQTDVEEWLDLALRRRSLISSPEP